MAECEACGTLDAQTFKFDGITFELCRHHAHVWMARCMKEDREEAKQREVYRTQGMRLETAGTIEGGQITWARDFTLHRNDVFARRATIESGWEFWYLRWVAVDTDAEATTVRQQRRVLGSLHKTAKTQPTLKKTLERYVNGARTFVLREIKHGVCVYAVFYENGAVRDIEA